MDKLKTIKQGLDDLGPSPFYTSPIVNGIIKDDLAWCVGEIERLSRIEDAILEFRSLREAPDCVENFIATLKNLSKLDDVMDANPRPKDDV